VTPREHRVVRLDHAFEHGRPARAEPRLRHRGHEVHLLGDEPAARPQRRDEPAQRRRGIAQPREEQPHVDEVKLRLGEVVGEDVVDADLEVRLAEALQHGRVEVGRQDGAVGADAVAQPRRDRAAARTDLQAAPAAADPARLEVAHRARVQERLERAQAGALPGARVVVGVRRLARRVPNSLAAAHRRRTVPQARLAGVVRLAVDCLRRTGNAIAS
jgi:hypothetical protein